MSLPNLVNRSVRFLPFDDRRAEITEESRALGRRALLARYAERAANVGGKWIGDWIGGRRHRQSESPQVVILVVVAVPAAVILNQVYLQLGPLGKRDRL